MPPSPQGRRLMTYWVWIVLIGLELMSYSSAWHAFLGMEKPPTVSGTTLREEFHIPHPDPAGAALDKCKIAVASIEKAVLICNYACGCNEACEAAWESLLRDATDLARVPQFCPEFANRVQSEFRMSISQTLATKDLVALQKACRNQCEQFNSTSSAACGILRVEDVTQNVPSTWLYPPSGICDSFQPQDDDFTYPFLTWRAFLKYKRENQSVSGGFTQFGEPGYDSWACVYDERCERLKENLDMACFRYHKIKGEFHWWMLMSDPDKRIKISPVIEASASFCEPITGAEASTRKLVVDAISGDEIPLSSMRVQFSSLHPDSTLRSLPNPPPELVSQFGVDDNDEPGCGEIKLIRDQRFWLELQAPIGYYDWRGWLSLRGQSQAPTALMPLSLMPVQMECSTIAIVLSWCPWEVSELDLVLVRRRSSDEEDDSLVIAEHDAYRFNAEPTIEMILGDNGVPPDMRSYGPETILLKKNVPVGIYEIWVRAFPSRVLISGCATVSLYSASVGTLLASEMVDVTVDNDDATDFVNPVHWWHAMNLQVKAETVGEEPYPNFLKRVSYQVVSKDELKEDTWLATTYLSSNSEDPQEDDFRPIFGYDHDGDPSADPPLPPESCLKISFLGFRVVSATSDVSLDDIAQFIVFGDPDPKNVDQYLLQFDNQVVSGGFALFEGEHSVRVLAPGYIPQDRQISIQAGEAIVFEPFFMIPSDGNSHVTLTWGDSPTDLDLYVLPVAVQGSTDNSELLWQTELNVGTQREGYLWKGINEDGCRCQPISEGSTDPCEATCFIQGENSPQAKISLDRTDASHGISEVDFNDKIKENGPETVTLYDVPPGHYRFYANGQLAADLEVEVWLGDGRNAIGQADTITLTPGQSNSNIEWFYIGFLLVTSRPASKCTGENRRLHFNLAGTQSCYAWFSVAQLVETPLGFLDETTKLTKFKGLKLQLQDLESKVADFAAAQYAIYTGGSCTCEGSVRCSCSNAVLVEAGLAENLLPDGEGLYVMEVPIPISNEAEEYTVIVRQAGYFDNLATVTFSAQFDSFSNIETTYVGMLKLPELSQARIELTWTQPSAGRNLDLFMTRGLGGARPLVDSDDYVYWNQPAVSGLSLTQATTTKEVLEIEQDDVEPEKRAFRYTLAVNVYGHGQTSADKCQHKPGNAQCSFDGADEVQLFTARGRWTFRQSNTSTGNEWWILGNMEYTSQGWAFEEDGRIGRCEDLFADSCMGLWFASMTLSIRLLDDSLSSQLLISGAQYWVYQTDQECACGIGTPTCVCPEGSEFEHGFIDGTTEGQLPDHYQWQLRNQPILADRGTDYVVLIRMPPVTNATSYYDRTVRFNKLDFGNYFLRASLVPALQQMTMWVLLLWEGNADLDLYVIRDRPVDTSSTEFVYKNQNASSALSLRRMSSNSSDGPEVIAIDGWLLGNSSSVFSIGVNVFSDYDGTPGKCFLDESPSCGLSSSETVEVYDSRGLLRSTTYTHAPYASEWWYVADATMSPGLPYSTWSTSGSDAVATCADFFLDSCDGLFYSAVTLLYSNVLDPADNGFSGGRYTVFKRSSCIETHVGTFDCQIGDIVTSGVLGSMLPAIMPGFWYNPETLLLSPNVAYVVEVHHSDYVIRHVEFIFNDFGNFDVYLPMVQIPQLGVAVVLLSWTPGPHQADLDLYIAEDFYAPSYLDANSSSAPPPPYLLDYIYEDKPQAGSAPMYRMSRQFTSPAFGFETALIEGNAYGTTYFHIAANVYSGYLAGAPGKCDPNAPGCGFSAGERLEFVDSSGIVRIVDNSNAGSHWWYGATATLDNYTWTFQHRDLMSSCLVENHLYGTTYTGCNDLWFSSISIDLEFASSSPPYSAQSGNINQFDSARCGPSTAVSSGCQLGDAADFGPTGSLRGLFFSAPYSDYMFSIPVVRRFAATTLQLTILGYHDRIVQVSQSQYSSSSPNRAIMVSRTNAQVILYWEGVGDADLYILNSTQVLVSSNQYVNNNQTAPSQFPASLGTGLPEGFEFATLSPPIFGTRLTVAVNLHSGYSGSQVKCFNGIACRFNGTERVEIYSQTELLYETQYSHMMSTGDWWKIGDYVFDPVASFFVPEDRPATCSDFFLDSCLGLYVVALTPFFSDAEDPSTSPPGFLQASFALYHNSGCAYGPNVPTYCLSPPILSGSLGSLAQQDGKYFVGNTLLLDESSLGYLIIITDPSYFQRIMILSPNNPGVTIGNYELRTTLVRNSSDAEVKVVLSWDSGRDLDLFIFNQVPVPLTSIGTFTYYNFWEEDSEPDDLEITIDSLTSLDGSEVVLAKNRSSTYTIAVNVFHWDSPDGTESKCRPDNELCTFVGGQTEVVEVYAQGQGLIAEVKYNLDRSSDWWIVGSVHHQLLSGWQFTPLNSHDCSQIFSESCNAFYFVVLDLTLTDAMFATSSAFSNGTYRAYDAACCSSLAPANQDCSLSGCTPTEASTNLGIFTPMPGGWFAHQQEILLSDATSSLIVISSPGYVDRQLILPGTAAVYTRFEVMVPSMAPTEARVVLYWPTAATLDLFGIRGNSAEPRAFTGTENYVYWKQRQISGVTVDRSLDQSYAQAPVPVTPAPTPSGAGLDSLDGSGSSEGSGSGSGSGFSNMSHASVDGDYSESSASFSSGMSGSARRLLDFEEESPDDFDLNANFITKFSAHLREANTENPTLSVRSSRRLEQSVCEDAEPTPMTPAEPETITFEGSLMDPSSTYTIAANVFAGIAGALFKCTEVDCTCGFEGTERLEVYHSNSVVFRANAPPTRYGTDWWTAVRISFGSSWAVDVVDLASNCSDVFLGSCDGLLSNNLLLRYQLVDVFNAVEVQYFSRLTYNVFVKSSCSPGLYSPDYDCTGSMPVAMGNMGETVPGNGVSTMLEAVELAGNTDYVTIISDPSSISSYKYFDRQIEIRGNNSQPLSPFLSAPMVPQANLSTLTVLAFWNGPADLDIYIKEESSPNEIVSLQSTSYATNDQSLTGVKISKRADSAGAAPEVAQLDGLSAQGLYYTIAIRETTGYGFDGTERIEIYTGGASLYPGLEFKTKYSGPRSAEWWLIRSYSPSGSAWSGFTTYNRAANCSEIFSECDGPVTSAPTTTVQPPVPPTSAPLPTALPTPFPTLPPTSSLPVPPTTPGLPGTTPGLPGTTAMALPPTTAEFSLTTPVGTTPPLPGTMPQTSSPLTPLPTGFLNTTTPSMPSGPPGPGATTSIRNETSTQPILPPSTPDLPATSTNTPPQGPTGPTQAVTSTMPEATSTQTETTGLATSAQSTQEQLTTTTTQMPSGPPGPTQAGTSTAFETTSTQMETNGLFSSTQSTQETLTTTTTAMPPGPPGPTQAGTSTVPETTTESTTTVSTTANTPPPGPSGPGTTAP